MSGKICWHQLARPACRYFDSIFNGDIDGELYVNCNDENYKLNKILYGLKQSTRLWYARLKGTLEVFGFKKLDSAECVFKYKVENVEVVIIVYIDELVILTADIEDMN